MHELLYQLYDVQGMGIFKKYTFIIHCSMADAFFL